MTDWQERVIVEHKELSDKLAKLELYLNRSDLLVGDIELLQMQHGIMSSYLYVLNMRISRFCK